MGVDRLPSGNYRARLMLDGQTCSATFTTGSEATDWMAVTRGRAVGAKAARRQTLAQYADRWLSVFDRYGRQHAVPSSGAWTQAPDDLESDETVAIIESVAVGLTTTDQAPGARIPPGAQHGPGLLDPSSRPDVGLSLLSARVAHRPGGSIGTTSDVDRHRRGRADRAGRGAVRSSTSRQMSIRASCGSVSRSGAG